MKKIIDSLYVLLAGMAICCTQAANAATFTATNVGNWTDPAVWAGGVAPGAVITNDTIVINSVVSMDIDVEFNGNNSLLNILSGAVLQGDIYNTKLTFSAGKLTGESNAYIDLHEVDILGNTLVTLPDLGDIYARYIRINTTSDLDITCNIEASDSIFFTAGHVNFLPGGKLYAGGTCIVLEGGSFGLNGGHAQQAQHIVWYRNINSLTSGPEIKECGPAHVILDLNDDNQVLTLGGDSRVIRFTQRKGGLDLNGKKLDWTGNYINTSTRNIRGNAASELNITLPANSPDWTSALKFETGTEALATLSVSAVGSVHLASHLDVNNTLKLKKGSFVLDGFSILAMGQNSEIIVDQGKLDDDLGVFDGTQTYNVTYTGANVSGSELLGTGLNNVTLNLPSATGVVELSNNATIHGNLDLNMGVLQMYSLKLTLNGGFTSTTNGYLNPDNFSVLNIDLATAPTDTIYFASEQNLLDTLNVTITDGSVVSMASSTSMNALNLHNGSVKIFDNIFSIGKITGATPEDYIMIDGEGQLLMELSSSTAYTTFPVGTPDNYTPVLLLQNSGPKSDYIVNVKPGVFAGGDTGINLADAHSVVNNTWNIISNGSDPNVELKLQWPASLEVNGFDRTDARLSRFTFDVWDHPTPTVAASIGGGMYELHRPAVTTLTTFAVVDGGSTLAVSENEFETFGMHPNPVESQLNISLDEAADIQLIDTYGKVLSTIHTATGKAQLNVASLPVGIYYVSAQVNGASMVQKLVKK